MNCERLGRDPLHHRHHGRPGVAAGRLYGAGLAGRAHLARSGAATGRGRALPRLRRRSRRRARTGSATPSPCWPSASASFVVLYLILRFQDLLPFNPQGFKGTSPDLAFNTAISFVTNTNWQSYVPETDALDLLPDGRADLAQLPVGRRRHRHGRGRRARLRRQPGRGPGQFLGRSDPDQPLRPAAVLHRDRPGLRRPGRASDPGRPRQRGGARRRQADHRALSRPPARRRSSSSAPTAAASSTPTPPIRSRTPTRSPT